MPAGLPEKMPKIVQINGVQKSRASNDLLCRGCHLKRRPAPAERRSIRRAALYHGLVYVQGHENRWRLRHTYPGLNRLEAY